MPTASPLQLTWLEYGIATSFVAGLLGCWLLARHATGPSRLWLVAVGLILTFIPFGGILVLVASVGRAKVGRLA